jgi:hypothetical protein
MVKLHFFLKQNSNEIKLLTLFRVILVISSIFYLNGENQTGMVQYLNKQTKKLSALLK